jgi:hypothetical protein
MSGARNRNSGHNYERKIAEELRNLGFEAQTSREVDRQLDSAGVDLKTNFPLAPQMKCMCNTPNIEEILVNTYAGILFWKKTKKVGSKFMPRGEFVVMRKDDFYNKFL